MQNPLLFSSEIQFISQKAKSEAPFSISQAEKPPKKSQSFLPDCEIFELEKEAG